MMMPRHRSKMTIDDDESSEDEQENGNAEEPTRAVGGVEKQAIPSQVFGSLKKDDDDDD